MKQINKILCLLLCLAVSLSAAAQEARTVQGIVLDEDNHPVIGAVVKITGEQLGALTDTDGKFTLPNVSADKKTIEVASLGYATQTVDISAQANVTVTLVPSANDLDELVIVGYGAQKKAHLTGAVATVAPSEISDLSATNMADMLQGMVAGVSVAGTANRPGESSRIVIRNSNQAPGAPSSSAGELVPLYVIDDYIADENAFNNLDPNMVESISILKDASASIYGARSAQGVVLVRTKRGQIGKPKISYSGQYGFTDEYYRTKMMDAYNYGKIWNAVRAADPYQTGFVPERHLFQYDELEAMKNIDYNMLDKHWSSALTQRHSVTVSGGSENATYFGGVAYNTQDGNIGKISYDRWNYRAGMDAKINKWTKVSLQVSGDYGKTVKAYNKVGGENPEKDYVMMLLRPRYIPEYITDPATGITYPIAGNGVTNSYFGDNDTRYYHFSEVQNSGDFSDDMPQNMTINSSMEFDFGFVEVLKGLKLKGTYSKSTNTLKSNLYGSKYTLYYFNGELQGRGGSGAHLYEDTPEQAMDFSLIAPVAVDNGDNLSRRMSRGDNYQLNFTATYARDFGNHSVSGLFSIEKSESESEFVKGERTKPYPFTNLQHNGAEGEQQSDFNRSESGTLAYIGRVNYAYDDKYLAEFLIRSDASTKFAPENYWGYFPSLSLGWVVSKESWFHDNVDFVDFLKVRGSFGLLGRDNITAWAWLQTYGQEAVKGSIFGNNPNQEAGPHFQLQDAVPNRNAHWDKSYKSNYGLDFNFLRNRLSATIDGYYNWNRDVFMTIGGEQGFLGTVGAQASPYNYGATDDYGMEFSLGWQDKINKDVKYRVKLSTGWNDNKIIKYPWQNVGQRGFTAMQPGERSDRGLWGYECIGMFRTYQEVAEYFEENKLDRYMGLSLADVHPGMLIYKDIRGSQKPDGTYYEIGDPEDTNGNRVDSYDMVKISDRTSNIYGFTLNLSADYKGIVSISTQLTANWGSYIMMPSNAIGINNPVASGSGWEQMEYTNLPTFWAGNMFVYENVYDSHGNLLVEQNTDAKYPNLRWGVNSNTSTFWKINAANVFLRNLTVAVTLPKAWVNKVGIESCRVNLTGQNLLDFYNPYPDKFMSRNSHYSNYPSLRRFTLGLNVSF